MATRPSGEMPSSDKPAQSSSGQPTDFEKLYGLSDEAILWIQLYHDLLFAIARTPARPLVIVTDVIVYENFRKHFQPESFASDQELFFHERNALLPTRIDMIKSNMKYQKWQDVEIIDRIAITSDMLEKYKELRGTLEPSEEIPNPEKNATLWEFLKIAVRNEYPALYSALPKDQALGSKGDQDLNHASKRDTHTTTADTRNKQSALAPAAHASQHALHSNAAAPSLALRSTSGITLVFKDIFMEDGKAKRADNGPRADHERVQRLPNAERPHRIQPAKVLGRKPPPQDADTSKRKVAPLSKRPEAEPARTTKRKAPLMAQQNDDFKAKKRAKVQQKGDGVNVKSKITIKWTKHEHQLLFDTINKWCHKNGVDKLNMKVVNNICTDAFKADESTRERSVIMSKTKNMKKIVDLIKKAEEMALHVDDVSKELRYPLAALTLDDD